MNTSDKKFENPEEVLKVLQAGGSDGDFLAGGAMDGDQQKDFLKYVRAYGVMLAPHYQDLSQFPTDSPIGRAASARFQGGGTVASGPGLVPGGARMVTHDTGAISGTYDSMFIGDTITRGAHDDGVDEKFVQEGAQDASALGAGNYLEDPVKFGRRKYECVKLRSSYAATTEFFVQSIVNGRLNQDLSSALAPRIVHDYEDLAINGDTGLSAGASKRDRLLRSNDGWVKQSLAESNVFSADADFIKWDHFMEAIKSVPDEYVLSDYRFWMNPHTWSDWLGFLAKRDNSHSLADAAMGGQGLAPMGIPVCLVPLMPRNMNISNLVVQSAVVRGTASGPFVFPKDKNTIQIAVDKAAGANLVEITFSDVAAANIEDRLLSASQICKTINDALVAGAGHGAAYANVATVSQFGTIELRSPTMGATSTIEIEDGEIAVGNAKKGAATLGLTEARTVGSDAEANTKLKDGSLIWLSPADNFCWHVTTSEPGSSSNGVRMFSKFEQSEDRIITDIYSYQDATLTAPQAMVTIKDVRIARPGQAV
jgi:hypothetical protein